MCMTANEYKQDLIRSSKNLNSKWTFKVGTCECP